MADNIKKKRIFISIPIPTEAKEEFSGFKHSLNIKTVKWVSEGNMHITVLFIGEVGEGISDISLKIRDAVGRFQSFRLALDKIIFAPPKKKYPTMIWARFKDNINFLRIVAKLSDSLRDIGQPEIRKQPIPHVTIARLTTSKSYKNIKLKQIGDLLVKVSMLELMESKLVNGERIYEKLDEFPLF